MSAAQNQTLLMYQQHTLVGLPNLLQSHTSLEVLNTTFMQVHTRSTWTDWTPEGSHGCLAGQRSAPGLLLSPPLGGTVCSETEMKSVLHRAAPGGSEL